MSYLQVNVPLPATAIPVGPAAQSLYVQQQATASTTPVIVSNVQRGHPTLPVNEYTQEQSRRLGDYWKVTCSFAQIPDRKIDFYFEQEAEARRFAELGVQTIPKLFADLDPVNADFVSLGVARARRDEPPNRYTGRASGKEQWHAVLWSDQYSRYADLWFPDASEAANYAPGSSISLPDLLLPETANTAIPFFYPPGFPVNSPVPPGMLGPLVTFQIFVVKYPANTYQAETYFTGGWMEPGKFHGRGAYGPGPRPAGYNFGTGIYFDDFLNNWQPLILQPTQGWAPAGPVGLGSGEQLQVVACRQVANGVTSWVIVYLIEP